MEKENLYYLKYEENRIIPLAREIWGDKILDTYNKLTDKSKDKFLRITFFYYWRCYKIRQKVNDLDEGMMFIVITSSIEALMSKKKHKSFLDWLDLECEDKTLPVKELLGKHGEEYGATRKFIKFWNNYVEDKDKKDLEENSYYFDSEYKKCKLSIGDIAKLLYNLRSDFVHDANYVPIANDREPAANRTFLGSYFEYERVYYFLGTTMDNLASIFEKGFEKYFKKEIEVKIVRKKIWPEYFEKVKSGKKRFELRVADFDVKEGDVLILEEWDPETKEYTGRRIEKKVDFVLKFELDDFGQKKDIEEKGLVVIQFEK